MVGVIVSCVMMMSCEAFCLCEFCQSEQLDASTRGMQKFHFDLRTGLWAFGSRTLRCSGEKDGVPSRLRGV